DDRAAAVAGGFGTEGRDLGRIAGLEAGRPGVPSGRTAFGIQVPHEEEPFTNALERDRELARLIGSELHRDAVKRAVSADEEEVRSPSRGQVPFESHAQPAGALGRVDPDRRAAHGRDLGVALYGE